MIPHILHAIVSVPWVYDRVQWLAGAATVRSRMMRHLATLDLVPALALDVGGGTGLNRVLLPRTWSYVCLDNDLLKLQGLASKDTHATALLADATCIPAANDSVGLVFCTAVAHHLSDERFADLLGECARVLNDTGYFIFLDPVSAPSSRISRLLWKYDRGSYPRTAEILRSSISHHFRIERWELFAIYHRYILGIGTKQRHHRAMMGLALQTGQR